MSETPVRTRKPKTVKPPPPAWRVALEQFWTGFSEPSRVALLAMLTVFAFSVAGAFWYFSPGTLAGPLGDYLPRSARDAEGFATIEAMRIRARPAERPSVLILGPSTVAQAFGQGEEVERHLEGATGGPWDVHMLTTPLQSPFDQLALLEAALRGRPEAAPPVVVALGVGMQRLGWDAPRLAEMEAQGRIGLRSDWVDEEMARIGAEPRPRTGIYLFDNYRFVIVNATEALVRLVLHQPAAQRVAAYDKSDAARGETARQESVAAQVREGQENAAFYFDMHRRMLERVAELPGVTVVLIEERLSPSLVTRQDLTAIEVHSEAEFTAFAKSIGADYWPVMTEADLKSEDYHDVLHVNAGAPQDRVRAAFARHFLPYAARLSGDRP